MNMEYELEPTFEKQDDGTTLMQKGVLVLTFAQYKALQEMGDAWMYDSDAWTQVCDFTEGMCGSLYQNVNLPEGPVQVELQEDGTIVKHPIGNDVRLAKRILNALPLPANCEGDVLKRINLIENILMEVLG